MIEEKIIEILKSYANYITDNNTVVDDFNFIDVACDIEKEINGLLIQFGVFLYKENCPEINEEPDIEMVKKDYELFKQQNKLI